MCYLGGYLRLSIHSTFNISPYKRDRDFIQLITIGTITNVRKVLFGMGAPQFKKLGPFKTSLIVWLSKYPKVV